MESRDLNVLIVDDAGIIRSMLSKTLRLIGLPIGEIVEAEDGRDALARLEENEIHLAIVDLNMPIMDGAMLAHRMREDARWRDVPIIILTSEGNTDRVQDLRSLARCEYLRKPVTPEMVRDVVHGLVDVDEHWGESESPESVRDEFAQLFASVIQKLAFVICDIVDKDDLAAVDGTVCQATMRFEGARRGRLTLAAPESACDVLAANVMGVDSEADSAQKLARDALGEVVSVTCGHFLSAAFGDQSFALTGPEITTLAGSEWQSLLEGPATIGCQVDDYPALLQLEV